MILAYIIGDVVRTVTQCVGSDLQYPFHFTQMKKNWFEHTANAYGPPVDRSITIDDNIVRFARFSNYDKICAFLKRSTFLNCNPVKQTLTEAYGVLRGILGVSAYKLSHDVPELERARSHRQVSMGGSTLLAHATVDTTIYGRDDEPLVKGFFNKQFAFPMVYNEFLEKVNSHVDLIATLMGVEW